MSFLDTLIYGVRTILENGVARPDRPVLNIIGATVVDNPNANRLDVTIPTGSSDNATHLPKPNTLCKRTDTGAAHFTGQCAFENISASAYRLASAVVEQRVQAGTPTTVANGWSAGTGARWSNITLGGRLLIPLDLPNGVHLTAVEVRLSAGNGHVQLPSKMPTIEVRYLDLNENNILIASQTDAAASVAEYQVAHAISASMAHQVVRAHRRYWVELVAESGTNGVTQAIYSSTSVTWTRPAGSAVGVD